MHLNYEDYVSKRSKNIPASFIRQILDVTQQDDFISLAGGLPNPKFFPVDSFQESIQKVLAKKGRKLFQYGGSQGIPELREWVAERYSKRYEMDILADQIIITNGSQQALFLSGNVLLDQGDHLMIERPSYLGAIQAFSAFNPVFSPVELLNDGFDPEDFERLAKQTGTSVYYAVPNFQNPSGISYSPEKRELLANLLEKYRILLIEDDPYGEISFDRKPIAPIKKLLPDQVIWTGSFSKMISPGIRLGWMCIPKPLMPFFVRSKEAMDLHSNNLLQAAVFQFLTDYPIEDHLQKICSAYAEQKNKMQEAVHKFFPQETKLTDPQGGMFLWAELPTDINMARLIDRAIQYKVMFVPGDSFFTEPTARNFMRLNFSNANTDMIEEGIKRLGMAISETKTEKEYWPDHFI